MSSVVAKTDTAPRAGNSAASQASVQSSSSLRSVSTTRFLIDTNGQVQMPLALAAIAAALAWRGRWVWAFVSLLAAMLWALSMATGQLPEHDKDEIRFNVYQPQDVVHVLVEWEQHYQQPEEENDRDTVRRQGRRILSTGLAALAKKYGRVQRRDQSSSKQTEVALLCQEAAYIGLRSFPNDDHEDSSILTASISLMALVAKDAQVRDRHLYQADQYGLDRPIRCLRQALIRAKHLTDPKLEQRAADIQRKGCLLLGALADDDAQMAVLIVNEGGLETILDAAAWYRCHVDVAKWALWAIFLICYENTPSKIVAARHNGIQTILQAMDNCADSEEVTRHGVAILFDMMREQQENDRSHVSGSAPSVNVWQIRKVALAAGLHKVLAQALEKYSYSMDIMMMGQEMLLGTDYRGQIPQYRPISDS